MLATIDANLQHYVHAFLPQYVMSVCADCLDLYAREHAETNWGHRVEVEALYQTDVRGIQCGCCGEEINGTAYDTEEWPMLTYRRDDDPWNQYFEDTTFPRQQIIAILEATLESRIEVAYTGTRTKTEKRGFMDEAWGVTEVLTVFIGRRAAYKKLHEIEAFYIEANADEVWADE